jgi:nitrogen fixation/metabolism regulation signal transduction histidine kinase
MIHQQVFEERESSMDEIANLNAGLIAERLRRAVDLLDSRYTRLENDQSHRSQLLLQRIEALEKSQADQEARLRTVADGVIRLNTQGSLAAVGQSMLSLILAAIAAWIGAR